MGFSLQLENATHKNILLHRQHLLLLQELLDRYPVKKTLMLELIRKTAT